MKLVIVGDDVSEVRGGIERHASELRDEFVRQGHSVDVRSPRQVHPGDLEGAAWVLFEGVRRQAILRLRRRGGGGPSRAIFTHGSFLEEARSEELQRSGTWRPSARFYLRSMFDGAFGRWLFQGFDVWFVLSGSERDDVVRQFGVAPERVLVSAPFLSAEFAELAEATPARVVEEGPFVVSVGRIEPRKNLPRMLAALEGSPYEFVVAGQDRGGLAALREEAARRPNVRWRYVGPVSEAEKIAWMKGATAVVVPSVVEGVPAAALEALALGRPVVLAGVAYGPEGPGVVRCDATVEGLRTAVASAALQTIRPAPVPTVRAAAHAVLSALNGAGTNSERRTPVR